MGDAIHPRSSILPVLYFIVYPPKIKYITGIILYSIIPVIY
jgi:hypothetical protein